MVDETKLQHNLTDPDKGEVTVPIWLGVSSTQSVNVS